MGKAGREGGARPREEGGDDVWPGKEGGAAGGERGGRDQEEEETTKWRREERRKIKKSGGTHVLEGGLERWRGVAALYYPPALWKH